MNKRIVAGLLGYLTLFCGAAMVPPFILAATAKEFDGVLFFLLTMLELFALLIAIAGIKIRRRKNDW